MIFLVQIEPCSACAAFGKGDLAFGKRQFRRPGRQSGMACSLLLLPTSKFPQIEVIRHGNVPQSRYDHRERMPIDIVLN